MTPPDPRDDDIEGLIERLRAVDDPYGHTGCQNCDHHLKEQAASALSRLQEERDHWRKEYLDASRGERAALARSLRLEAENEGLRQQLSASRNKPSGETGTHIPSSPQAPLSDEGGER